MRVAVREATHEGGAAADSSARMIVVAMCIFEPIVAAELLAAAMVHGPSSQDVPHKARHGKIRRSLRI